MKAPELQTDVRRFILTSIPSVPYLEAVLLARAEPATDWTPSRLARRLYVSEAVAEGLVRALVEAGVAVGDGEGIRYAPDPELRALLDAVAAAYAADLVGITALIHSRIDKRAQQFADAFRFRKE
jgi:DNA-binding IclR family transcriptional regulator